MIRSQLAASVQPKGLPAEVRRGGSAMNAKRVIQQATLARFVSKGGVGSGIGPRIGPRWPDPAFERSAAA